MTYSCQNRRLLKAERKNEKRRKGRERLWFSSFSLFCSVVCVGFYVGGLFFGLGLFGGVVWGFFSDTEQHRSLYLGCSSRSVHDKLKKHGCFLSLQSLYCKFVHDCFGVDCWVVNTLGLLYWLLLKRNLCKNWFCWKIVGFAWRRLSGSKSVSEACVGAGMCAHMHNEKEYFLI